MNARDKLAAAILRVVGMDPHDSDPVKRGIAPYFGAVLRGLVRRETPGLGTIAVTKDGLLLWDEAFVDKQDTTTMAGGLVHEVMHVVLKHHERFVAMGIVPEPTPDVAAKAYLANIAGDLAINPDIAKMTTLPDGAIMPAMFKLPDGLTMEEYYRRLLQQVQQQPKSGGQGQGQGQAKSGKGQPQQGQGNGQQPTQQPGAGSGKNDTSKVGKGWCGSCAGHPLPGEPAAKGGSQPDPEARSEAEMERFRKQTAEAVREYGSKQRGLVPAGLQRWADEVLSPPKIPWREKLARMVRGAVAFKSGAVDYTFMRPSRRQAGMGFGPGRPIVPALHAPVPRVACALDTSGSMSEDLLTEALSEVKGVLTAVGAAVTFVACDAKVHGIKPIKTIGEAVKLMKGGGGTLLESAVKAISELKEKPGIAIVLTDGYCDDPPNYGLTLLWCIVGGNKAFKPTHGEVIYIERDEDEEKEAA